MEPEGERGEVAAAPEMGRGERDRMDFVIIANDWSAGEKNPTSKHRIARELARRGHRVLWIEGSGMRTPSLGSGRDRGRILEKIRKARRGPVRQADVCAPAPDVASSTVGAIWVLAPLFIPFPRAAVCRWLNGRMCRALAGRWAGRLGFHPPPLLINYVPVLHHAMKGWGSKGPVAGARRPLAVYHCVDRWDAFGMYDASVMAKADALCCRNADLVIASSEELERRCRRYNPAVRLITHGVDHGHFARALGGLPRPGDLPQGAVVGFFGLISEWVDQELLVMLARELKGRDVHIVLIGAADVDVTRLKACSNVHLLGPRPFADLPAYAAHFAVGIIPFLVNDLTRAVNPIKLREMLSAGCPVVSTALPEVQRYAVGAAGAAGVRVAASRDVFVAQVLAVLSNPPGREVRMAISQGMAGETWEAKVGEMLRVMGVAAAGSGRAMEACSNGG